MAKDQVLLFNVLVPRWNRTLPVWAWRSYGIVCPDSITSNGNARMVAREVVSLMTTKEGAIEPKAIDPGPCTDIDVLTQILVDAYKACAWE